MHRFLITCVVINVRRGILPYFVHIKTRNFQIFRLPKRFPFIIGGINPTLYNYNHYLVYELLCKEFLFWGLCFIFQALGMLTTDPNDARKLWLFHHVVNTVVFDNCGLLSISLEPENHNLLYHKFSYILYRSECLLSSSSMINLLQLRKAVDKYISIIPN